MIAALYVRRGGPYWGLPDVECWDEQRDARLYAGPHAVVAHPPCARWCRLAPPNVVRWGLKIGDDGGTFAAALGAVRRWGGVLEHPAYSIAWRAYDLVPPTPGGWRRTLDGGWVCHVEQWHYGHPAKKATWLYAVNCDLPSLVWDVTPDRVAGAVVGWRCSYTDPNDKRPRISKRQAAETPPAFRDVLIHMARSVRPAACT
jgi:hypothetical protein